jgi:trehalose 6-phosphate phosphatase
VSRTDFAIDGIPDFGARLAASTHRFLGLDYDGTLAPFRVNRMDAVPLKGIPELIGIIAKNTTVAIVSGRPIREIQTLFPIRDVTIIGSHGFEMKSPSGELIEFPPDGQGTSGLDRAQEMFKDRFGDRVERKIASVAIHNRGMDPADAEALESEAFDCWSFVAEAFGLECRRFNGGVEIRFRARNKGVALRELLEQEPADSFRVYLGDDDTDEDAFEVLGKSGVGIKVGDGSIPTCAKGRLADPIEVRAFLNRWAEMVVRKDDRWI